MAKRKKCYYDFSVTCVGTSLATGFKTLAFRVTQLNATAAAGVNGAIDRYGNFLEDLAALTGGSPNALKTKNAVSAWVQPSLGGTNGLERFISWVDFIAATGVATGAAGLPYRLPGGTVSASWAGHEAIFTRHFRARLTVLRIGTTDTAPTLGGVLYVQRQHSIEV